jgi:hypothetical protein
MYLLAPIMLLGFLSAISAVATPTMLSPPSMDLLYTAPEGFENASPGPVLRVRKLPENLTTLVANTSQAYHILYQIPYNSSNIDESPSCAYYASQNPSDATQIMDVEWTPG